MKRPTAPARDWLVAEFDGGHVRFALAGAFAGGRPPLREVERYRAADFDGLPDACRRYLSACGARVRGAVLCVAGHVEGTRAWPAGLPWPIDADALAQQLRLERVELIDELAAAALALPAFDDSEMPLLWPCEPPAPGRRRCAVVAIGRPSGVATAVLDDDRVQVLAAPSDANGDAAWCDDAALAARAGDAVVARAAWDGVYLVGSADDATRSRLSRAAFRDCFTAQDGALVAVPVRLVEHRHPALLGAARRAFDATRAALEAPGTAAARG